MDSIENSGIKKIIVHRIIFPTGIGKDRTISPRSYQTGPGMMVSQSIQGQWVTCFVKQKVADLRVAMYDLLWCSFIDSQKVSMTGYSFRISQQILSSSISYLRRTCFKGYPCAFEVQ